MTAFCLYQCPAHHGVDVHTDDCPVDLSRRACDGCREEIARQEMGADPYFAGNDYGMFGDAE